MRGPLVLLALVAGCGGSRGEPTGPRPTTSTGSPSTATLDATLTLGDPVANTATVRWTGDPQATEAWVEYGQDGALDHQTPAVSGAAQVVVEVRGLISGRRYTWRAVERRPDGSTWVSEPAEVDIPATRPEHPEFTATTYDAERAMMDEGYVLTSLIYGATSVTGILDGDGAWVWYLPHDPGLIADAPRPSRDRATLLVALRDMQRTDPVATLYALALDGTVVQTTLMDKQHHTFEELPDGRFAWLGFDLRQTPYDTGLWNVMSDTLAVSQPGATDPMDYTLLFAMFDDYGRDFFVPCSHTLENRSRFGVSAVHEWTHTNSMAYVEELDAYFANVRFLDTFLKLDGEGNLLWRMGGEDSDFTVDRPWSHSHLSQVWDGGFIAFDNGDHVIPEVSAVREYQWDEATMTATEVWSFVEPSGQFMHALGDARKLPNGNVLIAWSELYRFDEVTPDGTVVWSAQGPDGLIGRIRYLGDLYALE